MTFGAVLTGLMLLFIMVGYFYTPYDPAALSLKDKLGAPSLKHLFGCDPLGRDVLSRTLDGAGGHSQTGASAKGRPSCPSG